MASLLVQLDEQEMASIVSLNKTHVLLRVGNKYYKELGDHHISEGFKGSVFWIMLGLPL